MPPIPLRITARHAHLAAELAVNLLLPWLTWRLLSAHTTEFAATAWSAAPPTAWSLLELARHRRADALSLLVLAGIALSLAAILLGGSPRMLLVRENLFTAPIGAAFLLSLALPKPLIYYAAHATFRRHNPDMAQHFTEACRQPATLHRLRIVTLVWGAGLVFQGVLLGWMAWTWPIGRFLIVSPILGYGILAALGLWTWRYRARAVRRAGSTAG